MAKITIKEIKEFVNKDIIIFHQKKINSLDSLSLNRLLTKNPYLIKAKNIEAAGELITSLLDAFLSSSEEKIFGDFLENLAIFIAAKTKNGHKSAATGIDLEFVDLNAHYLISIKSGENWGNSSQHKKLAQDFQDAVRVIKQSNQKKLVHPILGICYGKTKTKFTGKGYWKLIGQNFWYFISGMKDLYKDIIEPIGYRAKEHNEQFNSDKSNIINRLTKEFISRFCNNDGSINWKSLVEFNSGNYDLENFNL